MDSTADEMVTLSGGDIQLWTVSESSVHIRCITPYGDPVELNVEEVQELCEVLQGLAKKIA
jgi:hypothetical protein